MDELGIIDDVKMVLNYEHLLSRAVDRCLYFRCTATLQDSDRFAASVNALVSAMVDMPGKPLRSEIKEFVKQLKNVSDGVYNLAFFTSVFEKATEILANHKLLFKTSSYQVGSPIDKE